jgi:hypothetical protein
METRVARDQRLFLINMRNQAEQECRIVTVGKRVHGKARAAIRFSRPAPHFLREAKSVAVVGAIIGWCF